MSARVFAAQTTGLEATIVEVEVDISNGLHSFSIIGLPDRAVEEAQERIIAAIKNSGRASPQKGNKKIIVSLAPADLKKEGPAFDLSIALAYLIGAGELEFSPEGKLFLGELALSGDVRPIRGALVVAQEARRRGFTEIFVPKENAREAALVEGITVFPVESLGELLNHFAKESPTHIGQVTGSFVPREYSETLLDFSDVVGQETAKRGLLIAAAGRHNIALSGPPGTGKSMLAKAFPSILPTLSFDNMIETSGIHSVAGTLKELVTHPPFRAPHHTASYVAMVGGGTFPRPGEVTLAHNGVLFLDEFPEFDRKVIETLRQPLEDGVVHVSRARGSVKFPARFILVAAMNLCPCGNKGLKGKECICMPAALLRYERKISGPIVDRIDMWLSVPHVAYEKLSAQGPHGESSAIYRQKVIRARERQQRRFAGSAIETNSQMSVRDLKNFAALGEKEVALLNKSAEALHLSPRAYHRVIKLARTIADLDEKEHISEAHLLEALQYRPRSTVGNN